MMMPLSDEARQRLKKLYWSSLTGFTLALMRTFGERAGEALFEFLFGSEDEDDETGDEDRVTPQV